MNVYHLYIMIRNDDVWPYIEVVTLIVATIHIDNAKATLENIVKVFTF